MLTGAGDNEDAAVLRFPPGKCLIQTVDFFTPVVNDPYRFGQIAAANSLSDVYAMGGEPYSVMNIVCFPARCMDLAILKEILRGGLSKIREAGALLAGGHSVDDQEVKYGLSVSGVVDPGAFASNRGLRPGDVLVLTKPVGTGILATAVKANVPGSQEYEQRLWEVASRLNAVPGEVIRRFGLKAATDITGFGLGGHALEMSKASGLAIELNVRDIPVLEAAAELAAQGFVPAGSHANRKHFSAQVEQGDGVEQGHLDIVFDAQTSGGLLLAVPPGLLGEVRAALAEGGDLAVTVGRVLDQPAPAGHLRLF